MRIKPSRLAILGAVLALLLVPPPGRVLAGPIVSNVIVFGDSLSDVGNVFLLSGGTIPPDPPYFQGRFSNGPVWVEGLASYLGKTEAPSLLGGTDFAFGGARIATGGPVPPLAAQLGMYLALTGGVADPNALYVLWGGGNDLRNAAQQVGLGLITPLQAVLTMQAAATDLGGIIATLAADGARQFLVANLPNIGRTPEAEAAGAAAVALTTALSVAFDTALAAVLDALALNPLLDIDRLDTFSLIESIVGNPGAFGFSNVTDACFNGVSVCFDPEQYLFWDSIHPTGHGHRLVASAAANAVPEPATLLLLVAGLSLLAAGVRARIRFAAAGRRAGR
jgi:outer membrane lipase/esterase